MKEAIERQEKAEALQRKERIEEEDRRKKEKREAIEEDRRTALLERKIEAEETANKIKWSLKTGIFERTELSKSLSLRWN